MPEESKWKELHLLEKSKRGVWRVIFGRTGIVLLLLVLQVLFLLELPNIIHIHFPLVLEFISGVFSVVVGVYVLNTDADSSVKLTWLTIIMLLPVFGSLLYAYIANDFGHWAIKKWMGEIIRNTADCIQTAPETAKKLERAENTSLRQLATYVGHTGCYPVYENTAVTYYPSGEDAFDEMLRQLEQAEKFIFLEYFILDDGHMWGRMLDILAGKAKQGVEVRVMYDGTCEFTTLPRSYPDSLRSLGIKCKQFSPIMPFVSTHYNYRDHRKIMVIDGHTAFTGGINLADEYVNVTHPLGYWKDTAVMLKGDAVRSFTLMFLQMWHVDEQGPNDLSWLEAETCAPQGAEGFVLPYGDCPLDDYRVGEMVYIDILSRAKDYVYIMTPYLILDGELENALRYAAQRGVDVRIILPGVPDKIVPYALAKNHYPALIGSGVKVYEFTPGFVHAKVMVSDDEKAVVGTINMDYRSLYHHFECAVYMQGTSAVKDIKADIVKTLGQCREVSLEQARKEHLFLRLMGAMTKIFAPLM